MCPVSSAEPAPTLAGRRALVVGYGSIGMRHARILQDFGLAVSVVSRRPHLPEGMASHRSVADAVAAATPDYAIVATETSAHADGLKALADAGWSGPVLVEKPLFAETPVGGIRSVPDVYVGYQLRFHPAVMRLRELTIGASIISAQFYVGQHIEGWRPGRTARDSYSGHAALGGGVLRDLSHELDLALWLLGDCRRVAAIGGRFTELTADSDDAWGILAEFERCPIATLQLNYLDRTSQRRIVIVTEQHTMTADLISNSVIVDGQTETISCDRDTPIAAMHRAILTSGGRDVCDFDAGMRVVELMHGVERAGTTGAWVAL